MIALSRLINRPVAVTTSVDPAWPHGPKPLNFTWERQRIVVAEIRECWVEDLMWWERDPSMVVWRVADRRGGVYELEMHRGTMPPVWKLRKVYD